MRVLLFRTLYIVATFIPLFIVRRLVNVLMMSQGFGAGARIQTSGEIEAAEKFLGVEPPDGFTIVDVGANRGEYSIAISKKYPNSRVVAFEPSKLIFGNLSNNVKSYSQIVPYNLGLGQTISERKLYKESELSKISSLTKLDITKERFTETVRIQSLDELASDFQLLNIDLMKIDVEGHEMEVIIGAQESIKKGLIRCIQFEIGGSSIDTGTSFRSIYLFLSEMGYSIYLIKPRGVQKIQEYEYFFEHYSTTNYFAVLES